MDQKKQANPEAPKTVNSYWGKTESWRTDTYDILLWFANIYVVYQILYICMYYVCVMTAVDGSPAIPLIKSHFLWPGLPMGFFRRKAKETEENNSWIMDLIYQEIASC